MQIELQKIEYEESSSLPSKNGYVIAYGSLSVPGYDTGILYAEYSNGNFSPPYGFWPNCYILFISEKSFTNHKSLQVKQSDLIPLITKLDKWQSKKEYLFVGELDKNMDANPSHAILSAYHQFMNDYEHNRIVRDHPNAIIYCFTYLDGAQLFSCPVKKAGKLLKSNETNYKQNKTFLSNYFCKTKNGSTLGTKTGFTGFYVDCGYYTKKSQYFSTPATPGTYIGYDGTGDYPTASFPREDINTLKLYKNIYRLTKSKNGDEDLYYISVKTLNGDSDNSSTTGGAAIEQAIQEAIQPLELKIGAGALMVTTDYISNFKNWKVNFVPAERERTAEDEMSDQPTIAVVDTYQDNNAPQVLTIKYNAGLGGVKNKEIYATDKASKLYKLRQEEDEQDSLLYDLDSAIQDSMQNVAIEDSRKLLPITVKLRKKNTTDEFITLSDYFSSTSSDIRGQYDFIYYKLKDDEYNEYNDCTFEKFLDSANIVLRNKYSNSYDTVLGLQQERGQLNLYSLKLFEGYTRGHDFIQEKYTTVRPEERDSNDDSETSRAMSYDENYFTYKYTGRNIDIFANDLNTTILENGTTLDAPVYIAAMHSCDLLQELDITLGETYGEQIYFAEAIRVPDRINDNGIYAQPPQYNLRYMYKDSFKVKDFLDENNGGFNPTVYTEDEIKVITGKIDLLRCKYYSPLDATYENSWCDCSYVTKDGKAAQECAYQKLGFCPYRFETEKHPRRIRTLQQSKSNRFNLIQELCKVFEFYPYFYIEHDKNGRVLLDKNGKTKKHIFFMTEKGNENKLGFRYEKNLSNITRTTDSNSITTKLYVEPNDSEFNDDGLCSIDTAIDNISRSNYILDFSYYIKIGALDADQVQRDLYGIEDGDFAFLNRMGNLNQIYDKYSNLIITMTGETLTQLQAEIEVSSTGIETALEERKKIAQRMYQFKKQQEELDSFMNVQTLYVTSDTYKNYVEKYREQATILWGLVDKLFFSGRYFSMPIEGELDEAGEKTYTWITIDTENLGDTLQELAYKKLLDTGKYCKEEIFWYLVLEENKDLENYVPVFNKWNDFEEKIIKKYLYPINGALGKYKSLYDEVFYWKTERAKILNKINDLYAQFYEKYEAYIKEGTFSDSNYLTDNEYYWASVQVLNDSCEPKISYSIDTIDISPLPEYKDNYVFDLADTTYIEDIDFFGINKHTGFPNKEKVIVTGTTEYLDEPKKNQISVQNYSSKFNDLFSAITASVQSLTFNENIYKRASNFTAKQYVTTESFQDTLDIGDLTLLDTPKDNVVLDEAGAEGNDINNTASQYKLSGEGLFFSTDGGETWDLGVGPKGLNLDYAKFGSLDASKVQIIDGNYIYFLWDKDGINAYRNPATSTTGLVDFARFNKYGLSLIEKEKIRLRAGYEYLAKSVGGENDGKYSDELELKDQNIGFYLYNDKGQPIFKTETRSLYSEDKDTNYTTRLSLMGEIFATNKILNSGNNRQKTELIKTVNKYKTQYIIQENDVNGPVKPSEVQDTVIRQLIDISTPDIIAYLPVSVSISCREDNGIYIYTIPNFSIYMRSAFTPDNNNSNISNDLLIFQYYFNAITITSIVPLISDIITMPENEQSIPLIESQINNIIESNIQGTLSEEQVLIILGITNASESTGVSYDLKINSTNSGAHSYIITNKYGADKKGWYFGTQSQKTLLNIDTDAVLEIETASHAIKQTIIYSYNGDQSSEDLYVLTDNYGNKTYWKDFLGLDTKTTTNATQNGEVGVYINNKKALALQDSQNNQMDDTDFTKWFINADTSKEEFTKAVTTLYSGAERVFSIAAGRENGTSIEIQNILTVLKNGVLYMGGIITDKFGKELDVSGLSYLPDEIRVQNPAIVMSNSGQIWCDWDQFFCAYRDPETGILSPTQTSLLHIFKTIESWSRSSGSSNGTTTVSGYFIDEADVDNGT